MSNPSRKLADYVPILTEKREKKFREVLSKRQPDLTVVMENVHDPHNIFAIMRSCDAIGIMEIYIINTQGMKKKGAGNKSSSSANKWVKAHNFSSVEACVLALRAKNYKIIATHLASDSKSLYETDLTEPVALVFGNEKDGVSEAFLPHVDGNMIIPMVGQIQSLNVSVACAVSLYEAYRQRLQAGHYENTKLTPEQTEEIYTAWAKKS